MKAECTWGDGPDVVLDAGAPSKDGLYDLTSEEAFKLSFDLRVAAIRATELQAIGEEHDKSIERSGKKD